MDRNFTLLYKGEKVIQIEVNLYILKFILLNLINYYFQVEISLLINIDNKF